MDFETLFTSNALCYYSDYVLRVMLSPYADTWQHDWKLWFGLLVTLLFKAGHLFMHVKLKGLIYEHPTLDQCFKLGRKVGSNFVLLHALQYHDARNMVRRVAIPLVLLPSILEKLFFFWFARRSPKSVNHISACSIYMRFELSIVTHSGSSAVLFKTVCTFILQWALLIFYWSSVINVCGDLAYLFWAVSLLVQTSGELTHMFGEPWDYHTWWFLTHHAGNMTLYRSSDVAGDTAVAPDATEEEIEEAENLAGRTMTPSACAIYGRFVASVIVQLFGRQTIIDTLPLFLMVSENPIDFLLNCVATGFFMSLSQSAAKYQIVDLRSDGDGSCDESEDMEAAATARNETVALLHED